MLRVKKNEISIEGDMWNKEDANLVCFNKDFQRKSNKLKKLFLKVRERIKSMIRVFGVGELHV